MTHAYSNINENNAAILIDVWQEQYDDIENGKIVLKEKPLNTKYYKQMLNTPQYQLSEKIITFVDSRPDINFIILGSYNTRELQSDIAWYKNTIHYLGKAWKFKEKKLHLIKGNEKTDSRIIHWSTKKTKLSFHFLWEMKYFLSKENIDAVYYCGESWETCVRDRPIGYSNLFNLIEELNTSTAIRVKRDCVLTENNTYFLPHKNRNWNKIKKDEYELVTK